MRTESKYIGYGLLLLVPFTVMGFYKTYFVLLAEAAIHIPRSIHFHMVVSSVWILLLIVQPFLVYYKQYRAHRLLGKLSYILFPVMILTFIHMIIRLFDKGEGKDALYPAANTLLLLIFYISGIYYRKRPLIHMRYMIATALVFVDPTIGRIVFLLFGGSALAASYIPYGIIDLILLLLILNDKRHGQNFRPYLVSFFTFLTAQVIQIIYLTGA